MPENPESLDTAESSYVEEAGSTGKSKIPSESDVRIACGILYRHISALQASIEDKSNPPSVRALCMVDRDAINRVINYLKD